MSAKRGDGDTRFELSEADFHKILTLVSLVVLAVIGMMMFSMGTIRADEVGILVNNLLGTVEVYTQPGTYIYNSITSDLYKIDKREQTIVMTKKVNKGDRWGPDHIRIKTRDGSDVNVDVTINYQIIPDPELIKIIACECGPDDYYKQQWIRDYARSICRNRLGMLSTEEFYQSDLRTQKADEAKEELNKRLRPHGIQVNSVQVQDFHFYEEYEEKIKQKKLADQEVEEQKSQAKSAIEQKKRRKIEEENKKAIEITEYKGKLEKALIAARGDAEKVKKEADAYYYTKIKAAEAELYEAKQKRQGILAIKAAEAKGIEQMNKALEGEGGVNLVLMEYVRNLANTEILGYPVEWRPQKERAALDVKVRTKGQ